MAHPPIIIHIPHSSGRIPRAVRKTLCVLEQDLGSELRRVTDRFTDELFHLSRSAARRLVFPVSRLVVDPERFEDDEREPAARHGLGVVYSRTCDGEDLRQTLTSRERAELIRRYYRPHHAALTRIVAEALKLHCWCLIIDAHSFPSKPLPHETRRRGRRPDICIGTDPYHTPRWLSRIARGVFQDHGWRVALNHPFSGAIVPGRFHRRDPRVLSIMIEVARHLYMDEGSGEKLAGFNAFAKELQGAVSTLASSVWTGSRSAYRKHTGEPSTFYGPRVSPLK